MPVFTFIVSINSLVHVSFDRYLRITRHMDYEKLLTRRRVILLIALSWTTSLGGALIAPLLGWSCAEQHCCANDGKRGATLNLQQLCPPVTPKRLPVWFAPHSDTIVLLGLITRTVWNSCSFLIVHLLCRYLRVYAPTVRLVGVR